jgi:hypothetical protein
MFILFASQSTTFLTCALFTVGHLFEDSSLVDRTPNTAETLSTKHNDVLVIQICPVQITPRSAKLAAINGYCVACSGSRLTTNEYNATKINTSNTAPKQM